MKKDEEKWFLKKEVEHIEAEELIGTEKLVEDLPPSFEVYIDPGNASRETIQEYFEALNDLNIAVGGIGIDFKIEDIHVLKTVGAMK